MEKRRPRPLRDCSMTNHTSSFDSAIVPSFSDVEIAELRRSWELVVPIADEAAQLFYARLFELAPALRQLFRHEPAVQRDKFLQALQQIIACAGRPNDVLAMLAALGDRHVTYGVRPEHYTVAGEALLWTLDEGLGILRTREARNSWITAFEFVATAMNRGTPHPAHASHVP